MEEHIRRTKEKAYNKGYIAGYWRGVADTKSGRELAQTPDALLDCPIQFLDLSARPFNSLDRAGYHRIRDIVELSKGEIWQIRSLGRKGICEVAWALWERGIRNTHWNEWLYVD